MERRSLFCQRVTTFAPDQVLTVNHFYSRERNFGESIVFADISRRDTVLVVELFQQLGPEKLLVAKISRCEPFYPKKIANKACLQYVLI